MISGHPASESLSIIWGISPIMGLGEARSPPPTLEPGPGRMTQVPLLLVALRPLA